MPSDSYMARPTEVFWKWLTVKHEATLREEQYFLMGRIAMALEVLTVVKTLEESSLLIFSPHETISVLRTLLVDQDIDVAAQQVYDHLAEWRKVKFADVSDEVASAHASEPEARRGVLTLLEHTLALPGSDQSPDPPSSQ